MKKAWPELPPVGVGNAPLAMPAQPLLMAVLGYGTNPLLCVQCVPEYLALARAQGWTPVPYNMVGRMTDWCSRCTAHRATVMAVTVLPPGSTKQQLAGIPTDGWRKKGWTTSPNVVPAPNYTPCRMPLDAFMERARGLVGARIVLDDTACFRYGHMQSYDLECQNAYPKCLSSVEFTMHDAVVFTRAPEEAAQAIVRGLRGPVPVVVTHVCGDEAALFGPGVVVLDSLACVLPGSPQRVTLEQLAAARVVVFHQDVAQAVCGGLKRVLDVAAVAWSEGVFLVRPAATLTMPLACSLKRFRVPLFWTVAHPDAWPLLRPLASPAHYQSGKRRVPVWECQGPCQWLRHVATHCDPPEEAING